MRKRKSPLIKLTKETKEARRERVSSGIKFRATVFKSKKRKLLEKSIKQNENLQN